MMKRLCLKKYTVTTLNDLKDYQSIAELVIPDSIIYVNGRIGGFGLPLFDNHRNLGFMIHSSKYSLREKLFYLSQLGNLIDRVERVHNPYNRFQFGDLNEYNFIIDRENLYRYDIDIYYQYLDYIDQLGLPREVIDSFLEKKLAFSEFQKRKL